MHKIRIFSTAWLELGFPHRWATCMTKAQFKAINPITLPLHHNSRITIAATLATIQVKVTARTLSLWIMEESTWDASYWVCLNPLRAVLLQEQPQEATRNLDSPCLGLLRIALTLRIVRFLHLITKFWIRSIRQQLQWHQLWSIIHRWDTNKFLHNSRFPL